ncbi:hypothetical protein ABK040_009730 [Willaertia magna]
MSNNKELKEEEFVNENQEEEQEGAEEEEEAVPMEDVTLSPDVHTFLNQEDLNKVKELFEQYQILTSESKSEAIEKLDEALEVMGSVVKDREEEFPDKSIEIGESFLQYGQLLVERGKFQIDNLTAKRIREEINKKRGIVEPEKAQSSSKDNNNGNNNNKEEEEGLEEEEEEECYEIAWQTLEQARVIFTRHLLSSKIITPKEMQQYRIKLAQIYTLLAILSSENDLFEQAIKDYENALMLYEAVEVDIIGKSEEKVIQYATNDLLIPIPRLKSDIYVQMATCYSYGKLNEEGEKKALECNQMAVKVMKENLMIKEQVLNAEKSMLKELEMRLDDVRNQQPQVSINFNGIGSSSSSASSIKEESVNIIQPRKRKSDISNNSMGEDSDLKKIKQ